MPYDLEKRLVIGLSSSALFNLDESDNFFRQYGEEEYRKYQREKQLSILNPGPAFPFIGRLLSLNDLAPPEDPLVEVILLSRNDPDTGMRVMNSIKHYQLKISRALFLQGGEPHRYISPLSISLFLSANENDVKQAVLAGSPAGRVLPNNNLEIDNDSELRIAFDFDGVIADDEAEKIFHQTNDLSKFHKNEIEKSTTPHNPGPLKSLLQKLSHIQAVEKNQYEIYSNYEKRLRISIVTARNAPSHERVINTMRSWNIMVNDAFFLGGIEKKKILEILKPHIFFDDQELHLSDASPSVHIPFGIKNQKK